MFKSTRELFKQEETSFSSISWKQQLSTYLEKLPYSQVSCTWWTSDMESHGLLLVGLKIITSILLWRNEAFPFYLCRWCSLQANPCTGLKQNSSVHNTHCRGWQLVQTSNYEKCTKNLSIFSPCEKELAYLHYVFSLQRFDLPRSALSFTISMSKLSIVTITPAENFPTLSESHRMTIGSTWGD